MSFGYDKAKKFGLAAVLKFPVLLNQSDSRPLRSLPFFELQMYVQ